jgi:hypothetical protein
MLRCMKDLRLLGSNSVVARVFNLAACYFEGFLNLTIRNLEFKGGLQSLKGCH